MMSYTIYYSKDEGWIHILECDVDIDSGKILKTNTEVLPYSDQTLKFWSKMERCHVFSATRISS